MTVLTLVFLLSLVGLDQAAEAAPHAKVMRTQMDVDYTGRVRQAPGANSIHVGRQHHEVRDEEEDEPLEHDQDEDEGSSDWQARRVPNLGKPVMTAMTQMNKAIKRSDTLIDAVEDEVIHEAAKIPFGTIDDKDSLFHNAEEAIEGKLASGLSALTASHGTLSHMVDLADNLIKDDMKKDGKHGLIDRIKDTLPFPTGGSSLADKAANIAGMHVPRLVRDVQEDMKLGDGNKVLAAVQGHLSEAPASLVKEIVQDEIRQADPIKALKVAGDAAQLAQDAKNALDLGSA
jgi:hypothetical protein